MGLTRTTADSESHDDGNGDDEADGASEENGNSEERYFVVVKIEV